MLQPSSWSPSLSTRKLMQLQLLKIQFSFPLSVGRPMSRISDHASCISFRHDLQTPTNSDLFSLFITFLRILTDEKGSFASACGKLSNLDISHFIWMKCLWNNFKNYLPPAMWQVASYAHRWARFLHRWVRLVRWVGVWGWTARLRVSARMRPTDHRLPKAQMRRNSSDVGSQCLPSTHRLPINAAQTPTK